MLRVFRKFTIAVCNKLIIKMENSDNSNVISFSSNITISKMKHKVYRIVLTGGPCGGKTTGQARLSTFMENLGWKIYRVPETANLLFCGGIKPEDIRNKKDYDTFQVNLLKSMMQIEDTYFNLASSCKENCLVICDRGIMDAVAYMDAELWQKVKIKYSWNEVDLRDNRYNQVIHMLTAANGAEEFYTLKNSSRTEGIAEAIEKDNIVSQSWLGHPYYDLIDNSTNFEQKLIRMINTVCSRLNINVNDRLDIKSQKRKFLINNITSNEGFGQYQDFVVVENCLAERGKLHRRGQNVLWNEETQQWNLNTGNWTYIYTYFRDNAIEIKEQISRRTYYGLREQRSRIHNSLYKKRRCFFWKQQYFQLDFFEKGLKEKLIILETYTKRENITLPDFVNVREEITNNPYYSLENLSKADGKIDENR